MTGSWPATTIVEATVSGEELRLDAPRAERSGHALSQAGAELARLRGGIGAELEAAGEQQPWGRDDLGSAFQKSYGRYAPQILAAWVNIASYVEDLGERVVVSVDRAVTADEAGRRRMSDI